MLNFAWRENEGSITVVDKMPNENPPAIDFVVLNSDPQDILLVGPRVLTLSITQLNLQRMMNSQQSKSNSSALSLLTISLKREKRLMVFSEIIQRAY